VIYILGNRRLETAGDDFYIAPDAQVIGSVRLGHETSVWFNCVIRADSDYIIIGDGTNIQDGTVIHTDSGYPTELGRNVTVGHHAMLHSCTIGDGTLVANGAMVLDRVRIGRNCLIAAGALVTPDKEIPDGAVIMGSPGKIVREVSERDLAMMRHSAEHYQARLKEYRRDLAVDPRS